MTSRKISWEMILAGLAFTGIAIWLLNRGDENATVRSVGSSSSEARVAPSVSDAPLPSTVIIDLQNLESLKNLGNIEQLKKLRNVNQLEVKLQNLEKLSGGEMARQTAESTLQNSLSDIEKHLKEWQNGDFNIKLRDRKIYINRNYDVEEGVWSEAESGVYVYRRSFEAAGMQNLQLNLSSGNVHIVGGDRETGEITLQATGSIQSAEELQNRIAQNLEISEGQARIEITRNDDDINRINMQATLNLPSNLNVSVRTKGGHINISQLQGTHELKTSGGHITLKNLSGRSTAETEGGHITGHSLDGNYTLNTRGGHIKIGAFDGILNAKSGGGHIQIQNLAGKANVKTAGGNIQATVSSLNGPLDLSTSAGNITLQIPEELNADLNVRGSSVEIADIFSFSGSRSDGRLSGTINDGGIPLSLTCAYGSVTINANK